MPHLGGWEGGRVVRFLKILSNSFLDFALEVLKHPIFVNVDLEEESAAKVKNL